MTTKTKHHGIDADCAAIEFRHAEFETQKQAQNWIQKNRIKQGAKRELLRAGIIRKRSGEIQQKEIFYILKSGN